MNKFKPCFLNIPLAEGLQMTAHDDVIFEEKLDGVFTFKEVLRSVIIGETMMDGTFYAFDMVQEGWQITTSLPLRERRERLDKLCGHCHIPQPWFGFDGRFLQSVIDRGGEGVVIKNLNEPYFANWTKCKRSETFDLVVTGWKPGAVTLATVTGQDRGKCPVSQYPAVGSIFEVECFGLTKHGKLREPRPATNPDGSIKIRFDKMQ